MYGTIEEFSLGDILQLYQISGRTGTVRVWRGDAPAHMIYVDRGRVSGAGADDWNLVEQIRRIEWLTDDVKSQLDFMERDGGLTGLSLIARALLAPHAWEYFSERQLERLVYPVLIWSRGEFEATVDRIPRVAPLRIDQSPQQLVLSAARWEEEIRAAEQDGYSPSSSWVRTESAPPEVPKSSDEPCPVVTVMDQPRRIEDLAAAAGLSTLRVIDQIRQLHEAGQVRQQA